MPDTDTVLTAAGVILAGVLVARVFGSDARAGVRDLRFSVDAIPTPDGEDQFVEPGTRNIESGGGFGGGYRSRIESALKGDSVGL